MDVVVLSLTEEMWLIRFYRTSSDLPVEAYLLQRFMSQTTNEHEWTRIRAAGAGGSPAQWASQHNSFPYQLGSFGVWDNAYLWSADPMELMAQFIENLHGAANNPVEPAFKYKSFLFVFIGVHSWLTFFPPQPAESAPVWFPHSNYPVHPVIPSKTYLAAVAVSAPCTPKVRLNRMSQICSARSPNKPQRGLIQ